MKHLYFFLFLALVPGFVSAQWNVTTLNQADTVTFDASFPGVVNGQFDASGITPTPSVGQLNSNAWEVSGLSQGNTIFGGTYTSSDYAQGTSTGGVFSGGIYAWEVATGDYGFGVQPTGSDFTPGDITLKVTNNSGFQVDSVRFSYELHVNNDGDRGNNWKFSWAAGSTTSFTSVPSLDYLSPELSGGMVSWTQNDRSIVFPVTLADGQDLYLRWSSADSTGGGNRDEFALDDLILSLMGSTVIPPSDTTKPEVVDGIYESATQIKIAWSEGVDQASSETTANYSITPGITVTNAQRTSLDTVVLTLGSGLQAGTMYTVDIQNVVDTSGNANVMVPFNTQFVFTDYTGNDLVITEIHYNEPSGFTDETEFLEIHNSGMTTLELGGMIISDGVEFEWDSLYSLAPGEYALIVQNLDSFNAAFTLTGSPQIWEWDNGSLSNGGERIAIANSLEQDIDEVDYDDNAPWIPLADGDGYSLVLCDPATDNNVGTNWFITDNLAATQNGVDLFASPGEANVCSTLVIPTYPIGTITTNDANFEPDSNGVYCAVEGIVYGQNIRGSGLQFTVIDPTGGINIFAFSNNTGYTVQEGDEVRVIGTVGFFNGLTQLSPDSIRLLSTGNCIPFPEIVSDLDESTESQYIELRNVTLADTSQWPSPGGSSANLDLVLESGDTVTMRIDSDTRLGDTISAPLGVFHVIGIGGQFDSSSPFDENYQIFPMWTRDFVTPTTIPAPAGLVINELMADNGAVIQDGNGDFDDWLELYNGSGNTVDLTGYFLTNDAGELTQNRIPRCFENQPTSFDFTDGDWLLFWCDDEPEQGATHTNFVLDAAGGYTALVTPDGVTVVDSITFGTQQTDVSFGRRMDGDTEWVLFEESTPDASNNNGVVLSTVLRTSDEQPLRAYPNPVEDRVIYFNRAVSGTLYNTLGQGVQQVRNSQQLELNGAVENGMYFLHTEEGDIVKLIVR